MSNPNYKAALVTGASSGIGRAVARRLRAQGLTVIAMGRNANSLTALADEIGVEAISCDVTDTGALAKALAGREVDVLVNNAGVLSSRAPFPELEPDAIDRMIDTNLRSVLHLTRMLVPGMIERGRGHLFFLGSSAGLYPHPAASVYGATKAAISLFCDALRCDLLGRGIRVTEVVPGRVETDLYRDAIGREGAQRELYDGYESLRPDDVAQAIGDALNMSAHATVSRLELFPTNQAVGGARFVGRD